MTCCSWSTFAAAEPDLAAAGEKLLFHPGVGFGYLATSAIDGAPRVHPVMPVLVEDRLELFVVPSPKLADLRRDGRFALHSCAGPDVDDEFYVAGCAVEVPGQDRRTAALAASPSSVGDDHVLVELLIERALWAHYTSPPTWPPSYHRWHA